MRIVPALWKEKARTVAGFALYEVNRCAHIALSSVVGWCALGAVVRDGQYSR